MTYDKIIMELSERLADESDYDDNLQPKLQKLLDLNVKGTNHESKRYIRNDDY